jgi:hypothetical protein
MSRMKLAAAAGVAVLLLLCATTIFAFTRRSSPAPARRVARPPVAASPGASASQPDFSVALGGVGGTVRFLGASPYPADQSSWFSADGRPIELPDARLLNVNLPTAVPPNYEVALRIDHPPSDVMRLHVGGSVAGANDLIRDGDAIIVACVFTVMNSPDSASMELAIAGSGWKTIATNDRPPEPALRDTTQIGPIEFEPVAAEAGSTRVVARHGPLNDPHQIVVIDDAGHEHGPTHIAVQTLGPKLTTACTFDVEPEHIAKVAFQLRPITQRVRLDDISLTAGATTHPRMSVSASEK